MIKNELSSKEIIRKIRDFLIYESRFYKKGEEIDE